MEALLWATGGALVASAVLVATFMGWVLRREREARREVAVAGSQLASLDDALAREAVAKAREASTKLREQALAEEAREREALRDREARLAAREKAIDARADLVDGRERAVTARESALAEARATVEARTAETEELRAQAQRGLETAAGLGRDEARSRLLASLEAEDASVDEAATRSRAKRRENALVEARALLLAAVERTPTEHVGSSLVTVVHLPADEAKLALIGREGRNVRTIEAATGVDVLIDDTPGVVVLSSFDPLRREVAKRAIERLLQDGRVHPVAVEHAVQAARAEVAALVPSLGGETADALLVRGLSPALEEALGKLEFRLSYGQNVRRHVLETARLAAALAGEVGLDPALAARAGLLHDIGHALAVDDGASHVTAGAALLRREGEHEVAAIVDRHHLDDDVLRPLEAIVKIADRLSAFRPGARSEEVARSLRRLGDLEAAAAAHPGVERAFAVQAGREVRVLVDPGKVSDKAAAKLARDVARSIEALPELPGEVAVTVIREVLARETAK